MENKIDTSSWDLLQFEAYCETSRVSIDLAIQMFNNVARDCFERFGVPPNVEPISLPRPLKEVQRAHDLLVGLALDPDLRDELIGPEWFGEMRSALDTL